MFSFRPLSNGIIEGQNKGHHLFKNRLFIVAFLKHSDRSASRVKPMTAFETRTKQNTFLEIYFSFGHVIHRQKHGGEGKGRDSK